MTSESPNSAPANRRSGPSNAMRYWDGVLDPQNLERAGAKGWRRGPTLEDEIEFTRTPDFEAAARWLENGDPSPAWILDLGAGLGSVSFALARRGHPVVALDGSLARLRAMRDRADRAECAGSISCIVAAAEALPFRDGTVPAVYTKSVLIHTDLGRSARELARTLREGGRAALTEPQTGNPLVRAYRRCFAPPAWRGITRYFDPAAQRTVLAAFGRADGPGRAVAPFYFFSFAAFMFQFGWPHVRLFRWSLRLLHRLDAILFRLIRPLRRWAWFGLIQIEKRPPGEGHGSKP